jgi:adenine-specific DNA-methyltransferase
MLSEKISLFKKEVGEPYFESDNLLIYNEDCLKLMKKIPKSFVDLTITSPPYNIGKEYEKVQPIDKYVSWCKKWMSLVHNITKDDGAFLLNIGYLKIPDKGRNVPIPYLLWDKTNFYLMQEIIWNYGAGITCKNVLSPRNEKILWYVKNKDEYTFNLDPIRDPNVKYPNSKRNGKLRVNPLGKNPTDVWQIAKVTSGKNRSSKERTKHPAQFPSELIKKLVNGFSNPNNIILDPFIGSGTTAEVALKNKRFCIGFEIKKDYCDLAIERLKSILNQKSLLDY